MSAAAAPNAHQRLRLAHYLHQHHYRPGVHQDRIEKFKCDRTRLSDKEPSPDRSGLHNEFPSSLGLTTAAMAQMGHYGSPEGMGGDRLTQFNIGQLLLTLRQRLKFGWSSRD